MKLVNQTTGEDLDVNNNKLFSQLQRRGAMPGDAKPINAEDSMAKAGCTKCGLFGIRCVQMRMCNADKVTLPPSVS